jgi:hypothetical protein
MNDMVSNWFKLQDERGRQTFLVIEGASRDSVTQALHELEDAPEYALLFASIPAFQDALQVSPVLVRVTAASPIVDWFLSHNRFARLGLFLAANLDTDAAAALLASRLYPRKEVGGNVLCRWYDPQVLCDCMMVAAGSVFPFVVQGFSSVLMHGHLADCIDAWVVCDIPESTARWDGTLPLAFMDAIYEVRETRLLDRHIAALRGDIRQAADMVTAAVHGCDVHIFPGQIHDAVSREEREAEQAELRALKEHHEFAGLQDLFEARRLMTEHRAADTDAPQPDPTTPTHTRTT